MALRDGWTEMVLCFLARNSPMFDFNIPFLLQHCKGWLVGGAIRDILLGGHPTDLDIIAADNAAEYARELSLKSGSKAVQLGKPPLTLYRIADRKHTFDITDLNGRSIEEDLFQRDFSINAIALDLPGGAVIDCTGGRKDLERKTIRMVSDRIFQKDPIRLLRAFRLAAVLNFNIEKNTAATIKKEAHRIQTTSAERIQSELLKILSTSHSVKTLTAMDDAGLLQHILPEVTALKKCSQNRYHDFDAYHHTMATLAALEDALNAPECLFKTGGDDCTTVRFAQRPQDLKLTLLLHDIGKPFSRSIGPEGHIHFYGHEKISAHMAEKTARRLTLSNSQRNYITFIIRNHLYPMSLFQAYQKGALSNRAIIRLFRRADKITPDLLLHAVADFTGKKNSGNHQATASPFVDFAKELIDRHYTDFVSAQKYKPLITGRDIIKNFDLRPSPLFRIILDNIEESRLAGQLQSKTDALEWTKSFLCRNRIQGGS